MIKLEIENTGATENEKVLLDRLLEGANRIYSDDQEKLQWLKNAVLHGGMWAYRGGNHVAVHMVNEENYMPEKDRFAIFSVEGM